MRYNAVIVEALAARSVAWKDSLAPYSDRAGYGPPRQHRDITGRTSALGFLYKSIQLKRSDSE